MIDTLFIHDCTRIQAKKGSDSTGALKIIISHNTWGQRTFGEGAEQVNKDFELILFGLPEAVRDRLHEAVRWSEAALAEHRTELLERSEEIRDIIHQHRDRVIDSAEIEARLTMLGLDFWEVLEAKELAKSLRAENV